MKYYLCSTDFHVFTGVVTQIAEFMTPITVQLLPCSARLKRGNIYESAWGRSSPCTANFAIWVVPYILEE